VAQLEEAVKGRLLLLGQGARYLLKPQRLHYVWRLCLREAETRVLPCQTPLLIPFSYCC
jgi:hypothetical protein